MGRLWETAGVRSVALSRIYDALSRAEEKRGQKQQERETIDPVERGATRRADPFQVVSVVCPKGGVGKSTLAANLAVHLRAARTDLPLLALSLDDQPFFERLFSEGGGSTGEDVRSSLESGSFAKAIRPGRFGVHFVPTARDLDSVQDALPHPHRLREMLRETGARGVVIVDTRSDLGMLSRSALAAADLTIVPVKDQASLERAGRVYELLEEWSRPRRSARLLLSLVDQRIQFAGGPEANIVDLLRARAKRDGLPFFETFVSRSPKVEALYTNPRGAATPVLEGAAGSSVDTQLRQLAEEVRSLLDAAPATRPSVDLRGPGAAAPRRPSDWLA